MAQSAAKKSGKHATKSTKAKGKSSAAKGKTKGKVSAKSSIEKAREQAANSSMTTSEVIKTVVAGAQQIRVTAETKGAKMRAEAAKQAAMIGVPPGDDRIKVPTRIDLSVAGAREGADLADKVPHSELAKFVPAADRFDPVELLLSQNASRLPHLVPMRHKRMMQSAFAFYRGTAILMAADLQTQASPLIPAQICGDAHMSNFGFFASPDRRLVYDVNDFDETSPGPFEWDLRRLATSYILAARDNGFPEQAGVVAAAFAMRAYRENMLRYATEDSVEVFYSRVELSRLFQRMIENAALDATQVKRLLKGEKEIAKSAGRRNARQAVRKLTQITPHGKRIFVEDPPVISRLTGSTAAWETNSRQMLDDYRATLPPDRRLLAERYHTLDVARKVVGVGSVGTRCNVVLLEGENPDDLLILQVKEAGESVVAMYLPDGFDPGQLPVIDNPGERVVRGQQLMQSASDIFLGWTTGQSHDFFVRQFRDMKFSPDPAELQMEGMILHAAASGYTLAGCHARSGRPATIAAYLGTDGSADEALAQFGLAYADQAQQDYAAFIEAVNDGRVEVSETIDG